MSHATDTLAIRPASTRGHTRLGWLDSYHTFSFGDYRDLDHMGFHTLRVINDDTVAPGGGFIEHGHRNMEILTWLLDGELEHADSLGHRSVLRHGELQAMTAGHGIRHSELNASLTRPVHFLQVWIQPRTQNLPPDYDQKLFDPASRHNQFCLIASPDGRDESLIIQQEADIRVGEFDAGHRFTFQVAHHRCAWLHVARGQLHVNDQTVGTGDGVAVLKSLDLRLEMQTVTELLLFDLGVSGDAA